MNSTAITPRVVEPMNPTAPMDSVGIAPRVIDYPETDGQPMAETPEHRDVMIDAIQVLRRHFAHRPDVYVSGNMMMYYEEGEPRRSVSPDVFVAVGVEDKDRRTYLLWREAKGPDFVLEVTSRARAGTTRDQAGVVRADGGVGVRSLRPAGEYLEPPLQGFRLVGGEYIEWKRCECRGSARALRSEVLGLSLHVRARDRALRLYDSVSGEDLLTFDEEAAAREEAEACAAHEAAAREEAEACAAHEAAAREEAEARAAHEVAVREEAEARAEREAVVREEAEARAERVEAENAELRAWIREFERLSRTRQSPSSPPS